MRSWKLGSLFGIDIYVHWTFLFLPFYVLLMTLTGPRAVPVPVAVFAVVGVLLVFPCVLLHELGHALMARRFGIGTRDITMYPIGGVARLERMSERPWEEFWIAVAGPAVNVAIVAVILAFFWLGGIDITSERLETVGGLTAKVFDYPIPTQMLLWLFLANQFLVLFNMLPAFPMDGGRVLRAILGAFLGHLRATEVAATLGVAMAWLFALAGLGFFKSFGVPGNVMLIVVGLFVFIAGQQELAMLRYRAAQTEPQVVGRPTEWQYALDPATQPPEPGFSGYAWDARAHVWIEWRNGRPVQGVFME